jgi:hypothetical protein
MDKYKLSFEVENVGPIEFDVTESTFKAITKFCQENFPEYDWKTSIQ